MPAGSARLARIQELRASGASFRAIARVVGISHVRVQAVLRESEVVTLSARKALTPASGRKDSAA